LLQVTNGELKATFPQLIQRSSNKPVILANEDLTTVLEFCFLSISIN